MTKQEIVSFIKEERKKQKLSQKELAYKADIKRYQQILEIEQGIVDVGIATFIKVVRALGYELLITNPYDKIPVDTGPLFIVDFSKVESDITEPEKIFAKFKQKTVPLPFKRKTS
jgi:transcriptional regulator with XRE-family HTH domain